MNPFDPLNLFHLAGDGTIRNVTLALPTGAVRRLLPHGVELGPQEMTPAGTHPVILSFNDIFRLRTSFPSLLPSLTYHEHVVGVPFSYVTNGRVSSDSPGPYYFMPLLYLDSALATLGGVAFWGFPKRLASFTSDGEGYGVRYGGEEVVSVSWSAHGEHKPLDEYEHFEPQRRALMQPLLGMVPLGLGPFFAVADFPKIWCRATLRPLQTTTRIDSDYVTGLPPGSFPRRGRSEGIDESVIGSYELRAPWTMSMPYPPARYGSG